MNKEYGNHFSFDVKRLQDHYISEAEFLNDEGGVVPAPNNEFKQECDRLGRRMILLYAQTSHTCSPTLLKNCQNHSSTPCDQNRVGCQKTSFMKTIEGIETREKIAALCLQENIEV